MINDTMFAMTEGRCPDFTGPNAIKHQRAMCTAHGYTIAKKLFKDGRIPAAQARGMVQLDRDFIAEVEMQGNDTADIAEVVVNNWISQIFAGDMS